MCYSLTFGFRTAFLTALLGASLCSARGQTAGPSSTASPDGSKAKVEPRISLIAIGDPPSPSFVVKNDRRELQATPESEYPPTPLYVKIKGVVKTVSLGLNTPADSVKSPGGADFELFSNKECTTSFVKAPIPANPEDLTIFMVRNPTTKSWRIQPQVKVYENGLKAFPKDSLRVMNFSRVPVMIQAMGGQVFEVPAFGADSTRSVSLPPAEQGILTYRAAVHGDDGPIIVADTAVTYPADARANLVIYEADGVDKRQKVKVTLYFELPYVEPPVKDKDAGAASTTVPPGH